MNGQYNLNCTGCVLIFILFVLGSGALVLYKLAITNPDVERMIVNILFVVVIGILFHLIWKYRNETKRNR